MIGIPPVELKYWKLDPSTEDASVFLTSLLQDKGLAIGSYDGRVTAADTGIAASVTPNSGRDDPTMTAIGGLYTAMCNVYLNDELKFTSMSPFMDVNDQAFSNWDFSHVDPTGAESGGIDRLYTAGDLAAAMALNPYLRVFAANGYYDAEPDYYFSDVTRARIMLQQHGPGVDNPARPENPRGHNRADYFRQIDHNDRSTHLGWSQR
jgi:carboxypeptidase C (cathepsin A)